MDTLGSLLYGILFTFVSIIQVIWPFLLVAIVWRWLQSR